MRQRLSRWLKRGALATWRGAASARRNVLGDTDNWVLAGLVLLAVGLSQVYPPAAWIVTGVVVLGIGLWLSLPVRPRRPGKDGE